MIRSPQNIGKWLTIPSILLCLCLLIPLPSVRAQPLSFDHPEKFLKEHQQNILRLSSDKEALTFHQQFMSQQYPSRHSRTRQKRSHDSQTLNPLSQEKQTTITTFWAALTSIVWIQKFRGGSEDSLPAHLMSQFLPSDSQRHWLLSKPSLIEIKDLVELHNKLSAWPQRVVTDLSSNSQSTKIDQVYQSIDLLSNRQTWIGLFDDHGINGIQARLEKYWQAQNQKDLQVSVTDSQKQASIQHYIESKLLPILHAHLLTQANRVEAQAYNIAWKLWNRIQQWQQEERIIQAKMRLCGTWKWIIHNHQNHGDHKTTMTFSPPGQSTPPQVQPSTILIHGDTVFLKWTFPQGIQEDSLLFSNRDARLEGTFKNSLGPHGNISGQRLSPCKN